MFQQLTIVGNLGTDPESRTVSTAKGEVAVCNFSVATTHGYGENKKTEWHRVVTWDKNAENCQKYLKKGSKIFAIGKLETRSWENKEGQKCYATDMVANEVKFLDPKEKTDNNNNGWGNNAPKPDPAADDIPF